MTTNSINNRHPGSQGLTLVELMIGLAVAAVVLSIGVPSYRNLTANQTRVTAVNEFVMALGLARSHAVKSSKHVTVCRSTDSSSCAIGPGDWGDGWIVFTNKNRVSVASRTSDEELLRVFAPLGDAIDLSASGILANYVSFRPTGDTDVSGNWVYCDDRGSDAARAILLYRSGRAEASHTLIDGSTISCAGDSP